MNVKARKLKNEAALLAVARTGDRERLVEVLRATPKLAELFAKSHPRLEPNDCAAWILAEARTFGPDAAVAKLSRLILEGLIPERVHWAIYGITMNQSEVDLGQGFKLLKMDPTIVRTQLFIEPAGRPHWSDRFPHHDVVLTRDSEGPIVVFDDDNPPKHDLKRKRELESAEMIGAGILTITVNHLVACGASWLSTIPIPRSGGGSAAGHVPNQVPTHPRPLTDEQIETARKLFVWFYALNERPRHAVCHSLFAYQRCLGALHPFEDALLIAVSIETLLMEGEKGEGLANRFALRGSWLIGSDYDERRAIYDALRAVYGLRSDLAHTGGMSASDYSKSSAYFARALYVRMVTRILEKGYPDWHSMLLGGVGWKDPTTTPA